MFLFPLLIASQIGDERAMPVDARDDRSGKSKQALAGENGALALNDAGVASDAVREAEAVMAALRGGTPPELEAALNRLHQLHDRIGQRQLKPEDWPLLRILFGEAICEASSSDAPLTW
jgi:hypothetical protein